MAYDVTQAHSPNHCCRVRQQALNLQSACVCSVPLVTGYAKRMSRIALLPAACLALSHFSTLSHKRHDFREEKY